jgi:hypothetical protein
LILASRKISGRRKEGDANSREERRMRRGE